MIGCGSFCVVYEAVVKGTSKKVAIKGFLTQDNSEPMERDVSHGLDPRLRSEYTIMYDEVFNSGESRFVVMKLMKSSLKEYLTPFISSPHPKKLLSDEV
jgi:serine/threonine protein kinase